MKNGSKFVTARVEISGEFGDRFAMNFPSIFAAGVAAHVKRTGDADP